MRGKIAIAAVSSVLVFQAQHPPITPVDCAQVIDSQGRKVGNVVDWDWQRFTAVVTFQHQNEVFLLHVQKQRLGGSERLYFTTSDCTGTRFLLVPSLQDERVRSVAGVDSPSQTLYLGKTDATPQTITVFSTKDFLSTSCKVSFGFSTSAVPGIPVVDLATLFTPPFKVVMCHHGRH